jgi:hypothetical protein
VTKCDASQARPEKSLRGQFGKFYDQRKIGNTQPGRKRPHRAGPPAVRFAEVRLPAVAAPVPGLEVRLPDGTLLRGGSAVELAALVRALRA